MSNAEKSLNVDLSAKSRLIPYSAAADMLSLNNLYIEERDACDSYRMIFTVNPVCTNALFNAVTEPVYMEGSDSAISLVESAVSLENTDVFPEETMNRSGITLGTLFNVDQRFVVRDTEFSHERIGNFKYHCGYDIFNNHLLRTDDFEHAMMAEETDDRGFKKNIDVFNTIFDFAIDYSGNTVKRDISDAQGPVTGAIKHEEIRMYQLDNIKTMNTAFYDELRSVDGWYGFYNSGYINIPNGELSGTNITLNKILNNETPCGFIDMYPDRSLYSFIPKVNRYRRRVERNWDCTIVYPYKNDYDMFNRIMIGFSGSDEDWESFKEESSDKIPNAVKILEARVIYNNVGDEMIEMHSLLRHTLSPGDSVRFYYQDEEGLSGISRSSFPVRVVSVGNSKGDEPNRYFTVKLYDISSFCGIIDESSEGGQQGDDSDDEEKKPKKLGIKELGKQEITKGISLFYRRVENGYDDRYYFRKFKELLNYEYNECDSGDTEAVASAVTAIREPSIINEDSPKYIKLGNDYFKKIVRGLTYTQNKIAFAENIYGDRVAQVIFNDDICTAGLKDNLGRPLSTVYFTAIKTNRGHKEWYDSGLTADEAVEYSHCFGDVTSGLDLPTDSGSTEYNVRKLYNVFADECDDEYKDGLERIMTDAPVGNYNGTPTPLESGITLDEYDEFYGDIVEFNRVNFVETTIEKVYHRFNTAQRECLVNNKYYDINYDEIVGDLYDVNRLDE